MRTRQAGNELFEERFPLRSEDADIQKAIEESKRTAKLEERRRKADEQQDQECVFFMEFHHFLLLKARQN